MPAFRSDRSVLLRELGDFSLHPQGRPRAASGRPPARNDTTVTAYRPHPRARRSLDSWLASNGRSTHGKGAKKNTPPSATPFFSLPTAP